jgi:hypothetical protein
MIKSEILEIWKDVNHPVFSERYQISNLGRLKSKSRLVSRGGESNRYTYNKPEKIVSIRKGVYPHLFTSLYSDEIRNKTMYIHKMVAEAFIPRPSKDHVYVTHLDGDYTNNRVENLKWITASENSKSNIEKYPENRLKLKKYNEKIGYYKVLRHPIWNKKNSKKALKMLKWGVSKQEIARIFECSIATVYNLIRKTK